MTAARRTRLVALAAALALAALSLASCGGDDDADEPQALSVRASGNAERISVTQPKELEAGLVELRFRNTTRLPVNADLIRVDGNQSAEDVLGVVDSDEEGARIPQWIHGAGGVGTTEPGGTTRATQVLEPGTHYLVSSAETEGEEEGPDTAIERFEVTGEAPEDAELPETDGRVVADEYTFRASGLESGRRQIEFANVGRELHHMIAFPIRGDATINEVEEALTAERPPEGPPPVDFGGVVGTSVLDGGVEQTTTVNLRRGRNALVCFIPNRAGGPPHLELGMIKEVTVR